MNSHYTKFLIVGLCLLLISCGKKSDDETLSGDNIVNSNPQTAEDNKLNLEQTAIAFADEMKDMQTTDAINVLQVFAGYMTPTSGGYTLQKGLVSTPKRMSATAKNKGTINQMFSALDSLVTPDADLQTNWNDNAGTYIYNEEKQVFIKAAGLNTRNLTYIFPSTTDGKTNNAKLIIYEPSWYKGTVNGTNYNTPIPTFIVEDLIVDGHKIMSYCYALSIDKQTGNVTHLLNKLTVGNYSFAYNADNKESKSTSLMYTFAHLDKVIIEIYTGITGDWSGPAISENIDSPLTLIENADMYVQVLNVKLNGSVSVKNLSSEMDALTEADKADSTKEAAIIDKNVKLSLNYASNNRLIANVKYNPSDSQSSLFDNMIFEFSDGSKVSPTAYFSTGWDGFKKKMEEFFPTEVEPNTNPTPQK